MPIDIQVISEEQKKQILNYTEGHFRDLKRIDIAPSKLTQTMSALANADGGELFIGIDEIKDTNTCIWRGFVNPEAANGHIQAFEELFPLCSEFCYTFLACDCSPGLVLKVEISKTADIRCASNGKVYIRRGAQNLPVNDEVGHRRLEINKGIVSFETQTTNADISLITNSTVIIKFILDIVPSAEPESWLHKQQLIKEGKPTVAGVLLFSEEPQAILPKRSAVKIYRYKTKEKEGSRDTLAFDPITIEGCLYDQIISAVRKTVEITENTGKLGSDALETIRYPSETLHEIITNAVLHRDYSIADDVHVRIFDNRIEVESPGTLPGHVTVENILQERFARNGNIVRLINKFPDPPNKDIGEGLNTAFEAMKKLRLKEPQVIQQDNHVIVYIRHERLASPEEIILEYLETHSEIKNSIARGLCYIGSENEMKRIFQRLMKRNLIERVPGKMGGASAYRKKADNDAVKDCIASEVAESHDLTLF